MIRKIAFFSAMQDIFYIQTTVLLKHSEGLLHVWCHIFTFYIYPRKKQESILAKRGCSHIVADERGQMLTITGLTWYVNST